MATRSGRGRTSSSLAKLTRSRVGTSWSGKSRSLPGGFGAHGNQARWTARQTSSVRTATACVNTPAQRPGWDWRARYAFQRRWSTHPKARTRGCRRGYRVGWVLPRLSDADDGVVRRGLVDATHGSDHVRKRNTESASLILRGDREAPLAQDVE